MKIALINPNQNFNYSRLFADEIVYLNGIQHISTALFNAGHDLRILDFQHNPQCRLEDVGDSEIVGLTSLTGCYGFFKKNLPLLKSGGKTIVVGGSFISSFGIGKDNFLMKTFPEIDYGVIGEGELAVLGLVEYISGNRKSIPRGIIRREGEELVGTDSQCEPVRNLDDLSLINYSLWPDFTREVKESNLVVSLLRGCPNHCRFCYKIESGVRTLSPKRADEVLQNALLLNPGMLTMLDETFSYSKERTIKLAEIAGKKGKKYHIQTRVDCIDEDLVKTLRDSGCDLISLGIESFDREILRDPGKGTTPEQIYRSVDICHGAGLNVLGYFIVGLPGENQKSIETTLDGIKKTGVYPRARLLCPFPGTAIYEAALRDGRLNPLNLIQTLSDPLREDTTHGDWVPINLSDGLSNQELIAARDEMLKYQNVWRKR